MTPEEAIEIIWERHMDCEDYRFKFDDYPDGYDFEFDQAILMAAQALEEIQKYREIGTVEECREAREKQIPKAPEMKPYYEDMPDEEYLCCPTCGDILTDRIPDDNKNFYFHCLNCGQKFDWSDDTK